MATATHIIRSHYDPKQREALERETGQLDQEDPWITERADFGRSKYLNAPRFVAASSSTSTSGLASENTKKDDISSWYSRLDRSQSSTPKLASNPPRTSTLVAPTTEPPKPWFITKVLDSQPPSETKTAPPTLADFLSRDPPPLPNEPRFKPPVWLALGPSNKGYGMLERGGWTEGETLGRHRVAGTARRKDAPEKVKEVERWIDGDICEVQRTTIVDLTLSDEEEHDSFPATHTVTNTSEDDTFTALLAPIATTLKSDRLGIGLKAKTTGPYRASKKRITHNAAALAQHERQAEEAKRRRERDGRGRKGFERRYKRDESRRKELLAYMNE